MLKQKKIPQRQCVGCRTMKNKKDLIRLHDALPICKKSGRGAYLCPSADCLARARKSKALERAFAGPIPPEVYEGLQQEMEREAHGE